jgi:hypothetical protein
MSVVDVENFTTLYGIEQRMIIRFLYREGRETRDIQTRLSAQFGDAAYSLRSVQR